MQDDEDYIRVQDRRDAEYQRQYKEWIDSLSPEERRALAKTGLDQPSVPGYSSGVGMTRNAAESNAAVAHHGLEGEFGIRASIFIRHSAFVIRHFSPPPRLFW